MDKATQFLGLAKLAKGYEEKFLALYNGLKLLLGDQFYAKLESIGISRERIEDALLYLRNDEEKAGKTRLTESELSSLLELFSSLVKSGTNK